MLISSCMESSLESLALAVFKFKHWIKVFSRHTSCLSLDGNVQILFALFVSLHNALWPSLVPVVAFVCIFPNIIKYLFS